MSDQVKAPVYGIPDDWKIEAGIAAVQGARPWTRPAELFDPIWAAGIDGRDCVAINCDTGWKSHPSLPEPIFAENTTGGSKSDITDRHGHGTHTIGSMIGRDGLGGAPGSKLKVVKTLGDDGRGSNTIAALNIAAAQEGDIVSCSWGGGSQVDRETEEACRRIEESGKWLLFAAGNAGYNGRGSTVIAPAISSHNVAVSSINQDGSLSGFASGGPAVDLAAGGGGIVSCGLHNNLVVMSGSSMACPTAAGDLLLLRQVLKMLGMVHYLDSRGLVKFLHSEEFLRDAGPTGRDAMYGDGVITTANILNWIAKKTLALCLVWMLAAMMCGTAAAQQLPWGANVELEPIGQTQVTFLQAASAEVVPQPEGVFILAEELESARQYGVILTVGEGIKWIEIHSEREPFPPVVTEEYKPGQFIVRGDPGQKYFVSLRGDGPPTWAEVIVAPGVDPEPDPGEPGPTPPSLEAVVALSRQLSQALADPPTAANIKRAIESAAQSIEGRCASGQCPTLEAAKAEMVAAINWAPKNGRVDWYGGWRAPISAAINELNPQNATTYAAIMRAVAAGL